MFRKDRFYRKSKYIFTFHKEDHTALYHSIYIKTIYLPEKFAFRFNGLLKTPIYGKSLYGKLSRYFERDTLDNALDLLANEKFLMDEIYDEEQEISSFIKSFSRNDERIRVNILYIFPTDNCNYNCKYCFIEKSFPSKHTFSNMSINTAKRAIDYFLEETAKYPEDGKKRVIIYGGEPCLNLNVTKYIIEYSRKRAKEILPRHTELFIHLVTNGSRINTNFAEFLAKNRVVVAVSIDGKPEANDKVRISSKNEGTFQKTDSAIRILKKVGCNVGLSVTVGKHNVRNLDEHVRFLVEKFQPFGIGFNLIMDLYGKKNPVETDIGTSTYRMIDAFKFLRQNAIYEEKIMRKLKPFVEEKPHIKDCGAIGNQIAVSPEGFLTPCHGFIPIRKFLSSNINDSNWDVHEDPIFKEWSKRIPYNMEKCSDCPAISICGGGCPYNAFVKKGNIWELDEKSCVYNRILLEWMIWDVFENVMKSKRNTH